MHNLGISYKHAITQCRVLLIKACKSKRRRNCKRRPNLREFCVFTKPRIFWVDLRQILCVPLSTRRNTRSEIK